MSLDDDTNLVSFTDALTCVFGASIALFLIFVIFIKLGPSQNEAHAVSSSQLLNDAIAVDALNGDSTTVIRVNTPSCTSAEKLSIKPVRERDDWLMTVERDGQKHCSRIVRLEKGLNEIIWLLTSDQSSGEYEIHLEIGSVGWPPNSAYRIDSTTIHNCGNGTSVLAKIGADQSALIQKGTGVGC